MTHTITVELTSIQLAALIELRKEVQKKMMQNAKQYGEKAEMLAIQRNNQLEALNKVIGV